MIMFGNVVLQCSKNLGWRACLTYRLGVLIMKENTFKKTIKL